MLSSRSCREKKWKSLLHAGIVKGSSGNWEQRVQDFFFATKSLEKCCKRKKDALILRRNQKLCAMKLWQKLFSCERLEKAKTFRAFICICIFMVIQHFTTYFINIYFCAALVQLNLYVWYLNYHRSRQDILFQCSIEHISHHAPVSVTPNFIFPQKTFNFVSHQSLMFPTSHRSTGKWKSKNQIFWTQGRDCPCPEGHSQYPNTLFKSDLKCHMNCWHINVQ